MTIPFGPVPSRRLGRSLGINNIPPKSCSYSCLYCQVGATHGQLVEPQDFYSPEEILKEVSAQLKKKGQSRNRGFGKALAAGNSSEQAFTDIGQVVKGAKIARVLHDLAASLGVDMPISEQVNLVIYEGHDPHASCHQRLITPCAKG